MFKRVESIHHATGKTGQIKFFAHPRFVVAPVPSSAALCCFSSCAKSAMSILVKSGANLTHPDCKQTSSTWYCWCVNDVSPHVTQLSQVSCEYLWVSCMICMAIVPSISFEHVAWQSFAFALGLRCGWWLFRGVQVAFQALNSSLPKFQNRSAKKQRQWSTLSKSSVRHVGTWGWHSESEKTTFSLLLFRKHETSENMWSMKMFDKV